MTSSSIFLFSLMMSILMTFGDSQVQLIQDPSFEIQCSSASSAWSVFNLRSQVHVETLLSPAPVNGSCAAVWPKQSDGSVSQNVTLPSGGTAILRFWWIMDGSTPDSLVASFDSTTIAQASTSSSWTQVEVDLSSYCDGQSHSIKFTGVAFSTTSENLLDEVTIDWTPFQTTGSTSQSATTMSSTTQGSTSYGSTSSLLSITSFSLATSGSETSNSATSGSGSRSLTTQAPITPSETSGTSMTSEDLVQTTSSISSNQGSTSSTPSHVTTLSATTSYDASTETCAKYSLGVAGSYCSADQTGFFLCSSSQGTDTFLTCATGTSCKCSTGVECGGATQSPCTLDSSLVSQDNNNSNSSSSISTTDGIIIGVCSAVGVALVAGIAILVGLKVRRSRRTQHDAGRRDF